MQTGRKTLRNSLSPLAVVSGTVVGCDRVEVGCLAGTGEEGSYRLVTTWEGYQHNVELWVAYPLRNGSKEVHQPWFLAARHT
jgi:hypothetical protein